MVGRMRHHGPDASGVWTSPTGRCVFGHARLRVIDLQTGDQPFVCEGGAGARPIACVLNGAIYNFGELRAQLEDRGHRFCTRGEAEVVAAGYLEWGADVAEHLEGQFALAIWDEGEDRLLLARDRAGLKPLFVYEDDHRIAFASEVKGLAALPGADLAFDPAVLPLYLAYGYVPTPATMHRRVTRVEPASARVWDRTGQGTVSHFWVPSFDRKPVPWKAAKQRLREHVEVAVRRRLVAEVPVGAFLSGGLDSTILASVMARLSPEPVQTFAIGFTDAPSYDETPFARMAAAHLGTNHTELRIGPESIGQLDALVEAYDEPFGDSSALPTYHAAQLARERVTVALSGEGGDELFCGYQRFRAMEFAARLPAWLARAGGFAVGALGQPDNFRSLRRRGVRFFESAAKEPAERWLDWVGFFPREMGDILRPELSGGASVGDGAGSLAASVRRAMDAQAGSVLAKSMAANFRTYLPDDLLVKADRMGMAHGLELRAPFLDTELVQFAAALPEPYLRRGGTLKRILREAFAADIPAPILRRAKRGFAAPIAQWFRTPAWRGVLEERLLTEDARVWNWLRREHVVPRARLHLAGKLDYAQPLWALLTLESWLRR